jgi:hypothetical protein
VKQLRQYRQFVANGLCQKSWMWWQQMVITTAKIFIASNYCKNTNISWRKTISTKLNLVASNSKWN